MSVDRKEIDLIIRAAIQGGKTLDGVIKSISDIEKAIDAQTAAAKRGESSIDDLKATLLALQRAQEQLKDQASLIGQFERLATQIAKSDERAVAAAKSYTDFKAKLDAAGSSTDAQSARLIKLGAATDRWQATLAKQRSDKDSLGVTLRDAGIATDGLAVAEDRARTAAAELGIAINRTQQAISTYADDVRKARDAETTLAENQAFQRKLEDAAKLNKAGQYVLFWTNALNAADVSEKQLSINAALRKAADEAVATARGYRTLGTAAKALAGPAASLRDTIQGIVDPASQARTTLAGVEAQVTKIGAAVSAIKGPVADYRDTVQQLAAAQKAVGEQAGLVDAFNRQRSALSAAGAEFKTARSNVLSLAEALRNSSGQNDVLSTSLRSAQGALASSQQALQKEIEKFRELRAAMQAAGLSTTDIAANQARLTTVAQNSANALTGLNAAHAKYGQAVKASGEAHGFLNDNGRTTLSMFQRLRGELLALAASYTGIFGTINLASKAIDAFNTKQQLLNQLAIGTGGDKALAADEFTFVADTAKRLGINLEVASKGFTKLSVSAAFAKRSTQEAHFLFEAISEVSRVAGLSKDNLDKVFLAVTQIFSKGKVKSEEFTGQLAEHLPGLLGVAKQALPEFKDFNKAMQEGKVGLNEFVTIMAKYRELVSGQLPTALTALQADQERFNNEVFFFFNKVAEKGFGEEFRKLINAITKLFQGTEGESFAQGLSDKLGLVVRALRFIVENAETVKDILIGGVLIVGAKLAVGMGIALATLPARLAAIALAAGAAGVAVKALQAAFLLFTIGVLAFEVGTLLNKFEIVRKFGVVLVVGMEAIWTALVFGFEVMWAQVDEIFKNGFLSLANALTFFLRKQLGLFSSIAKGIGADEIAKSIDKVISSLTFGNDTASKKTAVLVAKLKADLAQIKKIGGEMLDEIGKPVSPEVAKKVRAKTPRPHPGDDAGAVDEKLAERRKHALQQLQAELNGILGAIDRGEKDSLVGLLKAIDDTHAALFVKISEFGKKFGGAESAAMNKLLTGFIGELKVLETDKFNKALEKEALDLEHALQAIDAQIGKGDKTNLDARLKSVKDAHEKTYDAIAKLRAKLVKNDRDTGVVDEQSARLNAQVLELQAIEKRKFVEDEVNALLEERKAKLAVIAAQEAAGLITALQAKQATAKVIAETQPKIEASVAAGIEYVQTLRDAAVATGASTTVFDTLLAKLIEARESAQGLKTELLSAKQANDLLANLAGTAFTSITDAIGKAITGLDTWQNAILATRNAFIKFAADFLMQIGQMILKQAILNALKSSGGAAGGVGGIISKALTALVTQKHEGGLASSGPSRSVPVNWFANAQRLHSGGVLGLAPNEIPAILDKNEEVLTASDPRHVMNGGKTDGARAQDLKIINMIDSGSVISEGLSTQPGTRAIINFISANRTEVKAILGV